MTFSSRVVVDGLLPVPPSGGGAKLQETQVRSEFPGRDESGLGSCEDFLVQSENVVLVWPKVMPHAVSLVTL